MQGADVARALSDDLLPGRERDPVREASTPFDRACTLLCISEQSFVGKRIDVSIRAKRTAAALAAVGGIALASGCGAAVQGASSSDTYTIGLVTSQTGPASQLGVGELRGAQMAVEHVNAQGGANGKKLVLKTADDQTKPDQSLQQTRDMIKSGVVAIVGPSVVAGCKAVGPLVKASGPINYCLSPGIKPDGYVWSSSAATADLAERAMAYWKSKGITRIGVINTTDGSGTDGGKSTVGAINKLGMTLVSQVAYDPTAVSVTSQLAQVTAGKPQALVVWATGTPVGVALKGIDQLGLKLPVMTTDGNLANTFLKRIADYTPETLLIPATRDFWWQQLPKDNKAVALEKDYHEKYQAKFNETPDFGPGVAYDAVLLIAEALKTAKSDDPQKLRAALEKVDGVVGVLGDYHMSATNHRGLGLSDVALVQAKNGTFSYVDGSR